MTVQIDIVILVGLMTATAIYLILQRNFVRILFGFILLSNAANLALIGAAGDPSGKAPPLVGEGAGHALVDPLPQALILTAIVIGFGVTAYLIFLFYRLFVDHDTDELDEAAARDDEGGAR
ncbi:MAG: NADH-quinone oxidoreductase subunit K [Opitutaceae bacterium]|nr:NADH-quinone oxidoreductase subunit K [Opitutaceae bacterium]